MNRIVMFSLAVLLLGSTSFTQPDRASSRVLLQEPLADLANQEVRLTRLTLAPGWQGAGREGAGAAPAAAAQGNDSTPTWETLVRTALPDGIEPLLSVNGLTMPAQPVNEHSHAGPVVGYILKGQIENQVELTRVLSEPTKLVLPNTNLTQWQVPSPTKANQELRLIRLGLPAGTRTEALAHSGPGLVYVADGSITVLGASPQPQTFAAGDLFLDPANGGLRIFRNASTREPATLLLYHLGNPQEPVRTPPMMPYVAIHNPVFVPASDAPFVLDDDLVIGVARGRTARAYMAADLTQHGSVDDQMPDGPIEVTWCSTCGTGAVFRAEIDGRRLHFEYDSMVNANEVHKDRETGSRWQQSTGVAISGPLKGKRLTLYPFVLTTWKTWRTRFPNTLILKPLPGYAERIPVLRPRQKQALTSGEGAAPAGSFSTDNRLRPKEMIAGLTVGNEDMAFALSALRETPVVNERVGGVPVVVIHQRSSDTTTAFEARANGRVLRFQAADADAGSLVDLETRSSWNAWGLAVAGRLKGTQLKQLILIPEFWFAWSQFRPGTRVFGPEARKS